MFSSSESNEKLSRKKSYTYVEGERLDPSKFEKIECAGLNIYVENEYIKKLVVEKFKIIEKKDWQTPETGIIQNIITMAQSYCNHIKIFALDITEVSDDSIAYHDPAFDEIRVPAANRKFLQLFLHEITHATLELASTQAHYLSQGKTKQYQDRLREAYCLDFSAYQKKREIHTYSHYEQNLLKSIFKNPHAEFYTKTEFRGERICNMIEAMYFNEKTALEIAPNYIKALQEYIQWEKEVMQHPYFEGMNGNVELIRKIAKDDLAITANALKKTVHPLSTQEINCQIPVSENMYPFYKDKPVPVIKPLTVTEVRELAFSENPQRLKYVILENGELIVSKEWTNLIPLTTDQIDYYSETPLSPQQQSASLNRAFALDSYNKDIIYFDKFDASSHIKIKIKHSDMSGLTPIIAAGDFYVHHGKIVENHPSGFQGIDNLIANFAVSGSDLKKMVESIFSESGYSEAIGLFCDKSSNINTSMRAHLPKTSNQVNLKLLLSTSKQRQIGHEKNSFSFDALKKEPVYEYVKHKQKHNIEAKHSNSYPKDNPKSASTHIPKNIETKHSDSYPKDKPKSVSTNTPKNIEVKHSNSYPKHNQESVSTNIVKKEHAYLRSGNSTLKSINPSASHTANKVNTLVFQNPNYARPRTRILNDQLKRLYDRQVTWKNPVINITKATNKLNSNSPNTKIALPVLSGLLILWHANTRFNLDKEMHPEVSNFAHGTAAGLGVLIDCTFPLTVVIGELANEIKQVTPESLQGNREFLLQICEAYDLSNTATDHLLNDFDKDGNESKKFIQATFDNTRACLTPFEIFYDAKMLLVDGVRHLANYGHQSATKETFHALNTLNKLQQDIALTADPVNRNAFHGDIISATLHPAIDMHLRSSFNQSIFNALDTNLSFNNAERFFINHAKTTCKHQIHPLEAASVNTIPSIGGGPIKSVPLIPDIIFNGFKMVPLTSDGTISGAIGSVSFPTAPHSFPIILTAMAAAYAIESIFNHFKNKEIKKMHRRTNRQCKQITDISNNAIQAFNHAVKKIDLYNIATTDEERSKLADEVLVDIEKAEKIFNNNQTYFASHLNQKNNKMDYPGKHHEHHQKKPTKKTLDYIKKSSKQTKTDQSELHKLSSDFVTLQQIKSDVDSLNSLYNNYNDSLKRLVTQLFNNEISLQTFQTYWTVIVNNTYTDATQLEQRIKENPHYNSENDHTLLDIKSNILKANDPSQYLISYYLTKIEERNKPSYDAINQLSYAHLAADCFFKLKFFHPILQQINDRIALTNPQTKFFKQSVISMEHIQQTASYGFDLYKETYAIKIRENLPSASKVIEQANITQKEQIDSIHSLFKHNDENSLMNFANNFFTGHNKTLLQGKLIVSFADFFLYLIYTTYQNTNSNNTLTFDEWQKEHVNKNTFIYAASKMYDAVKLGLIGISIARSVFSLIQLYQSDTNPLTIARTITHQFLSLSRLIDLKKWFNIDSEESKYQYFLQSFIIGNDYQQLVNTHDETILNGMAELLKKSSLIETYFGASGWLKHHKEQILNVCFVGNLVQSVAKTIMNSNNDAHHTHHQIDNQSLKTRGELYFEEQLSEKTPEPCSMETIDDTIKIANQVLEEAQNGREEIISKTKEIDNTLASISLLPKKNGFTLFSNFNSLPTSASILTKGTNFSVT